MPRTLLAALLALTARAAVAQDVINLHVNATDAQGRSVSDLKVEELRIADEGKPQPVASFKMEAPHATVTLAPGEFTNRPAGLSNPHVVLFDLLNLPMSDRRSSADQLIRALQKIEAPEAIYLYVLNLEGELVPVRALPVAAPVPSPAATPWVRDTTALEKAMGAVATMRANYTTDVVFRSKQVYGALETIAGRLAPMPGRKTISWITVGVPRTIHRENGEPFDFLSVIRQTTSRIAQAGVAVNPIAKLSGSDAPENRETLQEFADLTGGKLYPGDIERVIPDIIQASRVTYLLQFTPKAWDGKFHKVRTTSTRKGVAIQCEQGYQSDKSSAAPSVNIFQSPFDADGIGIRATVSAGPQPHVLRLHLNLDPHDLQLSGPLQLTFATAGYMPDGKPVAYAPVPINLNLTQEQRDKAMRDGLRLGHDVTVAEGMKKIRFTVSDANSKNLGALTIPVGN